MNGTAMQTIMTGELSANYPYVCLDGGKTTPGVRRLGRDQTKVECLNPSLVAWISTLYATYVLVFLAKHGCFRYIIAKNLFLLVYIHSLCSLRCWEFWILNVCKPADWGETYSCYRPVLRHPTHITNITYMQCCWIQMGNQLTCQMISQY
jgi:hypothetical protein